MILIRFLKPFARWLKFRFLWLRTCYRVSRKSSEGHKPKKRTFCFVIGCGRSGTTILGDLLSRHPSVDYLFEPYHLWAAVHPATDITGIYQSIPARIELNADDVTSEVLGRYRALFHHSGDRECFLEKTPQNATRIGFLESLEPGCRYVHIKRDGLEVAESIHLLATENWYKIAFLPTLNMWWGVDGRKWDSLVAYGSKIDYFSDEISLLKEDRSRGIYEWMVSHLEIARWRDHLGNRLLEIDYRDLTENPKNVVGQVCDHLNIKTSPQWLEGIAKQVRAARVQELPTIELPPQICAEFNRLQSEFGFKGRAATSQKISSEI